VRVTQALASLTWGLALMNEGLVLMTEVFAFVIGTLP
jgi:hypothetical protein